MAEKNSSRELSITLNVDVSEALTGLKAVQREAKKATQALRELESEASLRKGEVILTKEQAAEFMSMVPTHITISVPNIKLNDQADVEKIAREIAERLRSERD